MTSKEKTVSHMFSLKTFVKCYCLVMLWHVSIASGSLDELNPLLLCFVEFWKRWPECVSAARLRVAVECFVCDIMVVIKKNNFLCFEIATE